LEQSNQNEGLSFLAPCIYDETKQAEQIDEIISDVLDFAQRFSMEDPDDDDRVFREGFKLFEKLLPFAAPVIKHASFEEEREWRLVTTIADFDPTDAEVR